ncbi:MAG: DUF5050 domain-containing protein [Bacilli bacterium]|nr:DUF5050 domain-containing protein [Bacilli bacterium]
MKKKLLLLAPALIAMMVAGCSTGGNSSSSSNQSASTSDSSSSSEVISSETSTTTSSEEVKKDFVDVTFVDVTVTYDGAAHILGEVSGAPSGTTIVYTGRETHTNAGVYQATAKLSKEGYNDKELTAKLTINKGTITGVTFENGEFEYDGTAHSISVTGTIPDSATVTYSSDVSGVTNSAIEIGVYNITATIKDNNYNVLNLNATLTIKVNDDERYLKWSDDTLFFQNALHDNLLYSYNATDSNLLKVSGDNAVDIVATTNDNVVYVSKSLVSSSIKKATYDSVGPSVSTTTLLSKKARYVQYGDANTLYYVVNGLTQAKSGIYKADVSGEDPVITCLSVGKAKYLQLVDNNLYFADGNNGDKLSSISITGTNQTRSLVVDEKINNLHYEDGVFYYTVNNLQGDYIERYTVSNGRRKLTTDAGIDFAIIGDNLYYINVDKFSTAIWGDGVYKVNKSPIVDYSLPGTKVVESEKGLCSLTTDGSHLYYYDMDGYKLIEAQSDGTFVKDILDGFVKPEDPTPTSFGGDMETYNNKIYYLDIWDDKTLHSYNPQTGANVRLTANKVDNFSIVGDQLYLNMVSYLVNNDTYTYNLTTGGELTLLNANDGNDFVSDDTYLYYAQDNGSGVATSIRRTNLSTLVDEEIYNRGVSNLRLIGNKLYFIDNNKIYSMDTSTLEVLEVKPNGASVHTTVFDSDGTNLYYREMYGALKTNKRLSRYNLSTGEYAVMAQTDTDPITIVYHEGYVYYYNDVTSASKNGIFRVAKDVTSETAGSVVLACNSTYYATTFTFLNSDIYFLNYKTGGLFGDSHIYKTDLTGAEPVKVA